MDKTKIAKILFGLGLFIFSLVLIAWLFGFLISALNTKDMNPFGVIVTMGTLLFSIFYLFSISVKIMGQAN